MTEPSPLPPAEACPACDALRAVRGEGHPHFVAELRTGVVLLHADQRHAGHLLFVAKRHVADLPDLAADERDAYLTELGLLSQAVRTALAPRRLNAAAGLDGLAEAHLTWHVVPRHADDPTPDRPFWDGSGAGPRALTPEALADLRRRLLRGLLAAAPMRREAVPARPVRP